MNSTPCACKGIRSCNLCSPTKDKYPIETSSNTIFIYCDACRQAIRMDIYESNSQCPHHNDIGNADIGFSLDGIYLVSDFLSETEENNLIESIDNDIWIPSQSGRLKQDFGIKINFKKQTIKTKYFTGMPMYSKTILERLKTYRLLNDFQSVELCNLDYRSDRGSHIDPHIDDIWIWGERLITINLLSNTILTLIPNENTSNKIIYIPLPRRWMIVLYGDARYEYKHSIQQQHIQERRLAVTFRELTGKNEKFYDENKDLYERIIRISKRFTGISVGKFEQIVNEMNLFNENQMDINLNTDDLQNLSSDKLIKLFPCSVIPLEQLKQILSSLQLNEIIDEKIINDSHVIMYNPLPLKQLVTLLAHWRLISRTNFKFSWKNSFDNQWFKQEYRNILEKKKNSYPFLLSNLYTCQEQICLLKDNQLEYGLIWMKNEQTFYLIDLILICLTNIDHIKEILDIYQEIIKLTDDEKDFFDIFLRLQMVLLINNNDIDDDKQLDFLEQLSSNVFFVRDLIG